MRSPTVTVVIITYLRPDVLHDNLAHLAKQTVAPHQVLVVDASPDRRSEEVCEQFPFVTYTRNPRGVGNMTSSRNEALPLVTGEIIAFLDDDALVRPDYVEALARFYATRPEVRLGCARTLNLQPGEESEGADSIGRMTDAGVLLGHFAADPGHDVPIDHGIGATMSFRTSLVGELGGFREYYTGISGVREDADAFLRAKTLGEQAWFVRDAVAVHVAAPQSKGQRFDLRYTHWTSRNHAILLMANAGLFSSMFWRCFWATTRDQLTERRRLLARAVRTGVYVAGWFRGLAVAVRLFGVGPQPPVGGYRQH